MNVGKPAEATAVLCAQDRRAWDADADRVQVVRHY